MARVADAYVGLSAQAGPLETEVEKGIKALQKYQRAAEATAAKLKGDLGGQGSGALFNKTAINSDQSHISTLTRGMMGIKTIIAGFATGAIAGIGAWAITLSADAEKAQTAFSVMLRSEKAAKDMLVDLKQYANVSPFSNVQVRESAQLLLNYGVKARDLLPTMKQIGDIAAGDAQKMEGLSRAFGQMSSAGRLMGQDLNQMINAGFNPLQVISEKTGESMFQLKARMEAGKIGIQEVKDAMTAATSEGGQFAGMTEKQSQTLGGLWSSAVDVVENSLTALGDMLVESFDIKGLVGGFNDSFAMVPAGIEACKPIVKDFIDSWSEWFGEAKKIILGVWDSVSQGSGTIGFMANSVSYASRAIQTAFSALKFAISPILDGIGYIAEGWEYITSTINGTTPDYSFAEEFKLAGKAMRDTAAGDIAKAWDAALPGDKIAADAKKATDAMKAAAEERSKLAGSARVDLPAANPAEDDAAKLYAKLNDELRELQAGSKIASDLYNLQQKGASQEALTAIQSIYDEVEATKKLKKERDEMAKEAEKVIKDIMSPAEKAAEEFEKLKSLFENEKLTEDQFNKAVAKLDEGDNKKEKPQKANSAMLAGSEKFRESLLLQMNPAMNKKDDLQKKANEYLADIAKNIKENMMAGEPQIEFQFVS